MQNPDRKASYLFIEKGVPVGFQTQDPLLLKGQDIVSWLNTAVKLPIPVTHALVPMEGVEPGIFYTITINGVVVELSRPEVVESNP